MKLFNKLFRANPKFDSALPIIFAFEVGGRKYYQFDDAFNIPCERALKALTYYEELRMRCTREFLQMHCEAVEKIISDPKRINIAKLAILNQQLKERLDFIIEPDIAFKLASVVFFDKTESPYLYDFKYAGQKIEFWKKHKGTHDFFLQSPLRRLIPFLEKSGMNLEIYSQVVESLNKIHLDNMSTLLSEKRNIRDSVSS